MKKICEELKEVGASKSHYKLSYCTSLHGLIACVLEEMRLLAASRKIAPWRCRCATLHSRRYRRESR